MMARQPVWQKLDTLGSGGFGQVSLWENLQTREKIAIKVCQQLKPKHLQRWEQEVEIMQSLDHPGLVKFHEVPSEIKASFVRGNVALGMEYCEKGDLRRMLSQSENCCGLSEQEVRAVLGDIGSAINYLHDNKIVHRDIKPENIVLKSKQDSMLAYKIIDLGYAKDLSEQTWAQSFVGTPHYLAPEFFGVQPLSYTATVDFWSFGLVVFECITGRRPFYPHLGTMQFLVHLREKKKDVHICTVDNDGANPQCSAEIPKPHHLNPIFETKVKSWLKCMLLLDPNRRGNLNSQDNWYSQLEEILSEKVVSVFDVHTQEVVTVPVEQETSVAMFKNKIADSQHIPQSEQILLFNLGDIIDHTKKVLQQFETRLVGERVLYLFSYQLQSRLVTSNRQVPDEVSSFLGRNEFNSKLMKRVLGLGTNCVATFIKRALHTIEACAAIFQSMVRCRSKFQKTVSDVNTKYHYFLGMVTVFVNGVNQDIEGCRETDDDDTGAFNTDELYTQLVTDRDNATSWLDRVKMETSSIMKQSQESMAQKEHLLEPLKQRKKMLNDKLAEAYKKHEMLRKQLREAAAHEHRPNNPAQTHSVTGAEMVGLLKEYFLNFVYPTVKHLKDVEAENLKIISLLLKKHEGLGLLNPRADSVLMSLQHYITEMQKLQMSKQARLWNHISFMRQYIREHRNCLSQFSNERVEDNTEMNQNIVRFESFVRELHEGMDDILSLDWDFGVDPRGPSSGLGPSAQPPAHNPEAPGDGL